MSQYFPKPYEPFGGDINVKVDLSNYVTKTDLKNISHIDVSSYALKSNLVSLKTEVDRLDIDKLTSVPIDLAKLSNAVKNDAVKKIEYDKLVNKVNDIDTTKFVSRNKYEKDGSNFEDKIDKIDKKTSDFSDLVKKTDFNSKIIEVEGKIPSLGGLATNSALTAVENKISDVSGLATNSALTAVENKIPDVTSPVRKKDFNTKLKVVSALKALDLSYFWSKNYFDADDETRNLLVFQPAYKYFKAFKDRVLRRGSPNEFITEWKSKGLNDAIKYPDNSLAPGKRMYPKFKGSCLKQDKPVFNHGKIANIYIVYDLETNLNNFDPALENCLLAAVQLTKNSNGDKYK